MKKSNSTKKALSAFKKLGVVALITATMFFTACNQAGGGGGEKPKPTPKPKHAITFSVDSTTPNGTLKAKADGVDETSTSPINVEEGKTVTFTATANDGYRVKGWTLDGKAVNGSNNSYSFTVSKAVSVKVSFEDNSTPKPKHAITFNVDGGNGTLKAQADGVDETSNSPITVEEDKTVTFTAEPSTNYRVKEWKVGDTVVTGNKTNTYTHIVKKAVTVTVSFEANNNPPNPPTPTKYTVTLNQTANGTVTASSTIPQDGVDKDTVITFTAQADAGYRVNTWVISPSKALQSGGNKGDTTATLKITANTSVSVSFEEIPKHNVTFSVEGGHGTLKAVVSDKEINSGDKVEEGKTVTFTATAESGYRVNTWVISPSEAIKSGGKKGETTATLKITANTTVSVSFEAIPDGAILTLAADKNVVGVWAKTEDNSDITVVGCTETTLPSENQRDLHAANGAKITLKGKIIELSVTYIFPNKGPLTALDVSGLATLQKLSCGDNQLTSLNASGLTQLKEINCYSNKLTSLNVQGCTALQKLACSSNELPELNVKGLTQLQTLEYSNNKLTALDVQGLTVLKNLQCNQNKLTSLKVKDCTALEELDCRGNNLTALDVQGLTKLKSLDCDENQLKTLDASNLTELKTLNCNDNQLTALNISGCTALKFLKCSSNKLNAEAMTALLNALPQREANEDPPAVALLYTEETGKTEDNYKDFKTPETPADLKKAFDDAKGRNWKLKKETAVDYEDI